MGPDNIPSFLVKDCISCLCQPLSFIFNLILTNAVYPAAWKVSKVYPVFKSGDKTNIQNYRPIANICNFSKLFECILSDVLYSHFSSLTIAEQHGFIRGKSTLTNLCEFVQNLSSALDARLQVDVVYTDMSKAFDTVDVDILLSKLDSIGLCDNLIKLFHSMLHGRRQFVEYRNVKSAQFNTPTGVTQGSILGPLLFNIYINSVKEQLSCPFLLYADDLKIFNVINSESDCVALQKSIDSFVQWCSHNRLTVNITKCCVLTCSRKISNFTFDYNINGIILEKRSRVRDLGVVIDSQLSFSPHIEKICEDALKMLGFVKRNTRGFVNIDTLLSLYYCYIRNKLEYCSLVWSPHYDNHVNALERVQRRFLKYLYFVKYHAYPVQNYPQCVLLATFSQSALADRRCYSSVLFLYKLVDGTFVSQPLLQMLKFQIPRPASRYTTLFSYEVTSTMHHFNSPLYTAVRNYNKYNQTLDLFCGSSLTFKKISKSVITGIP